MLLELVECNYNIIVFQLFSKYNKYQSSLMLNYLFRYRHILSKHQQEIYSLLDFTVGYYIIYFADVFCNHILDSINSHMENIHHYSINFSNIKFKWHQSIKYLMLIIFYLFAYR